MKISSSRLKEIIKDELRKFHETEQMIESVFDPDQFKLIYREVKGSLQENPAAMAAAAMAATQLRTKQGKQIKATTALRNPEHDQHKKAKSMFQRLKDKFSKKEEPKSKKQSKGDADFYKSQYESVNEKLDWDQNDSRIASEIDKVFRMAKIKVLKHQPFKRGFRAGDSATYGAFIHVKDTNGEKTVLPIEVDKKGIITYAGGPKGWHKLEKIGAINMKQGRDNLKIKSYARTADYLKQFAKLPGFGQDVLKKKESVTVTRSELKGLVGEVMKEGRFEKLGVPVDRASKVRLLAIMKKLKIPLAGPKTKNGYTLSQKGNKGVLTVPSKYFDDVIEQMIKMNLSVRPA